MNGLVTQTDNGSNDKKKKKKKGRTAEGDMHAKEEPKSKLLRFQGSR